MSSNGSLDSILLRRTSFLNLKLWVVFCICIGGFIFVILVFMILWVTSRTKSRKKVLEKFPQIPDVPKDIAVDIIEAHEFVPRNCKERDRSTTFGKQATKEPEIWKQVVTSRSSETDNMSQGSSVYRCDRARNSCSEEERILEVSRKPCSSEGVMSASPLVGLPEVSQVGWGHWFTLRDLELATNRFSKDNVIGEGGYGVVYRGRLANGTDVAVKKILNNMGQAEKEFKVEVEAIGNVRHKNLVRLLGYCIEGVNRLLVYEYVNNGNLEQWLHGAIYQKGCLSWENRMKIAVGTAKALAYLHEAIEPKVVHRDIKSSNILIDDDFNAKISDFGLAKLMGAGKSHIATRVMGTFGYVAPEYANTGLLNEKSDVYSFGVLLLEAVTGREPVDYSRPANEVNLVEWLKYMVGSKRTEEVIDSKLDVKPSTRALKCALLIALRCLDPDSGKRPKMSHVVQMFEAEEDSYRADRRKRRSRTKSIDIDAPAEGCNSGSEPKGEFPVSSS